MKRTILTAILLVFTISAFAQIENEDLAVIQAVFHKDKKDITKGVLKLNEAQSKAFWPLYEEYEAKRQGLGKERVGIINDYLKTYNKLTAAGAEALVFRTLTNDKAYTDLEKTYFSKFSSAVGGLNAAKFYQLESYLTQIIKLHVQDAIPFIGELEKQKH